jgi:hypothetical protein
MMAERRKDIVAEAANAAGPSGPQGRGGVA